MSSPQSGAHRLGPGLPGYLIPFAPLAFASASEEVQSIAFATGVPSDIYAFHRSTGSSIDPYPPRGAQYPRPFPSWTGGFHRGLRRPPTRPLSPVIPNNVSTVRLTAAAGTNLARASSGDLSLIYPP